MDININKHEMLDPEALTRFGRLELIARLVVEGVMAGRHRSPFKGFSVEFAEHRQYGPGDEIRHIDWRAFGKTDRYFVKEYEEETNLKIYLVIDSSRSMTYAASTVSKLEHARRLSAALAYLAIRQRDAVGLIDTPRRLDGWIPPRSAPGHFAIVCKALEAIEPVDSGPTLAVRLHGLADRVRRRGLVVVLSDGLDPIDELTTALRHLRHRHHEVLFFHVLAPEEEIFPFRHPARFRGLEAPGEIVRVDSLSFRAAYLERFEAFRQTLTERVQAIGADYQRASTAEPVEQTLLAYLAVRRGRRRGREQGARSRNL